MSNLPARSNVVQLTLIEPAAKVAKRKTRLPEDWHPSEANIAYAEAKGLSLDQIAFEAESFVNYWLGTGKPMMDWSRVWNTWILRASQRLKQRSSGYNSQFRTPRTDGII